MKKTLFSSFLFLLFITFISISYLSFFGYETDRFNKIIKSQVKKSKYNVNLDFKKITILLDIKKFVLYVKFLNPKINYSKVSIPLEYLRSDIDLEFLSKRRLAIKKIIIATEYLEFTEIKSILEQFNLKQENFKNIETARFKIKKLNLEFDKDFKLKDNFNFSGIIDNANIKLLNNYKINDLSGNFRYDGDLFHFDKIIWSLKDKNNIDKEFFDGEIKVKKIKKRFEVNLKFKTSNPSALPRISIMNYAFEKGKISEINTSFLIDEKKNITFKKFSIIDNNNTLQVKDLKLNNNFNLINFKGISVKTSIDNIINNHFEISNKDKIIINGKIFDAKMLIKELSKDNKKNNFLKSISKDIKIDFNKIVKGAKFPIKNFSLIGQINNGEFEKILAKSDFSDNQHLDISLTKDKNTQFKVLEIYSDIALPLLNDYKFFQGLEGGKLSYVSKFNKKDSSGVLIIKNFKINKAPVLAKLLTLADLKGLTDTLRGDGISFDTLEIKYENHFQA